MNDVEVVSHAEVPSTVVRSLGVPTVNLDRALQVAGDLEDVEIARAIGADARGSVPRGAADEAADL